MKIRHLKTDRPLNGTEKLIKKILERNLDAFKASKMQFIRNNKVFSPFFTGLIA